MERPLEKALRWILPTLGGILALVAYAFPLFVRGPSLFARDGDPGRHIRLGAYIITNRTIPEVDLFSHTMYGAPFVPFEWLSEVIFAVFHGVGGLAGVAVLTALLFAGSVAVVHQTMRRAGVPSAWAFGFALLSMLLQATHLHARPHIFTTLLVAIFALFLLDARRSRHTRRLLWLPALLVVWVNLHGGFLVGFILLALFTADAWVAWGTHRSTNDLAYAKGLSGILAACLLASLVNPAGLELWPHATGYLGEEWLLAFTQEYNSPDFHHPLHQFFLAVMLGGTAVLALIRSSVGLFGLTMWLLFSAFALHSVRNIPLFGVLAIPWMALWTVGLGNQAGAGRERVRRWMDRSREITAAEDRLRGWPAVVTGMGFMTALVLHPESQEEFRFSPEVFPVGAVEEVLESGFEPPGPVFNEFGWGGYLLFKAWPDVPVFIDGQTDFYGETLTKEYMRIRQLAPDWQELLDKHRIRWALIPPDAPLNQALSIDADWAWAYADSTAVIWTRGRP